MSGKIYCEHYKGLVIEKCCQDCNCSNALSDMVTASGLASLVIPDGAEVIGNPPRSYRFELGQPATVGELRSLLSSYPDEEMLMFRKGPLPTFYLHILRGDNFIEFD